MNEIGNETLDHLETMCCTVLQGAFDFDNQYWSMCDVNKGDTVRCQLRIRSYSTNCIINA